jgi:cytochrome c-type biogenesis protein
MQSHTGETAFTLEKANTPRQLTTFTHAILFVTGFALVFIIGWGGTTTLLGQMFGEYKSVLGRIGGIVVIIFGLANLGALKTPGCTTTPAPSGILDAVPGLSLQR